MKNNLKKYVVLSLLIAVMFASVPKIDASAAGMSSGSVEKLLTKEVKEMLEDFELGEAEQEYLEELKEKFDAGELDSEKEILNEITSAEEKFGFLTGAFRYGAPPHGGMGIGLDRLVMQMLGVPTLRDVIAYPKVQNMRELMTDCPAVVDEQQLIDLGIAVVKTEE